MLLARSTQANPREHGVVVLSGEDVVPPGAPHVHPHPVLDGEPHHAAGAGHLAAFVRQRGVIQRHQLCVVLDNGALSAPVRRRVEGEVVEALFGAGEDARFAVVAAALVEQHRGELEHAGGAGVAVADGQFGSERHSACVTQRGTLQKHKQQKQLNMLMQINVGRTNGCSSFCTCREVVSSWWLISHELDL